MADKLMNTIDLMEKEINSSRKSVSFYLLNTKYTILLKDNKLIIKNSGFDYYKKFNNIDDLFSNYYIYGKSLIDYLDEIKIIK